MVNLHMTITAKHQRIVTTKSVGIDDAAASYGFNRKVCERLSSNIFDRLYFNHAITLQYAENRDFPGSPSASLALASASEITLIHLYFSTDEFGTFGGIGNDSSADDIHCLQNRRVTESHLPCNLSCREFEFKELYNPEPVLIRDSDLVNPTTGKVMECIFAPFTPESLTGYSVDFIAPAPYAETTVVFPT